MSDDTGTFATAPATMTVDDARETFGPLPVLQDPGFIALYMRASREIDAQIIANADDPEMMQAILATIP